MTKLSLAMLALLTLVLSLVAVVLWTTGSGTDDRFVGRGQVMFPELVSRSGTLETIEVTTSAYQLTLQQENGVWRLRQHADYPMSADKVAPLISQVAGLRAWEAKTSNAQLYDRLGVEAAVPAASSSHIVISDGADDKVADLLVGRNAVSIGARPGGGVFVRTPADTQSWLAAGRVIVPQSIGEWLGTVLHISAPDIRKIDVLSGDRMIASAQKPPGEPNYELTFFDPAIVATGATAKDEGFKAMTRGVVTVTAVDVVSVDALSFPPDARQVVFETEAGLRLAARIGAYNGRDWVAFLVSEVAGSTPQLQSAIDDMAARVNDYAFLLEDSKLAALMTPMGAMVELPALQAQPLAQ
jgi:hypothetical protein